MDNEKLSSSDIELETENTEEYESNFKNDPEWLKFDKDCEEYKYDFTDITEEVSDEEEYYVRYPINHKLIVPEKSNQMVILGYVSPQKKTKSFKYSYNSKKNFIFCNSLIDDKIKCNSLKCKLPHTFNEIPFCNSNCKRITYNNNFYSGNCNKRHNMETLENFLIRKNIKMAGLKRADLGFFEKPSSELVKDILLRAKKLNFTDVKINIIPKKITFSEFLANKPIIEEDKLEEDIDILSLWN